MITKEEAYKIASNLKEGIDYYEEFEKCFAFYSSEDDGFGGSSPIVVVKSTGEGIMYVCAINEGLLDDEPICEGDIA